MEKYQALRREYPRFYYRSYELCENEREVQITYRFEIQGLSSFAPVWKFPKAEGDTQKWGEDALFQKMVFSLGMVELVSYWKITCSPQVFVEAGALDEEQILWWKDLYFNGLGEFFYVNEIDEADPSDFMEIRCWRGPDAASGKPETGRDVLASSPADLGTEQKQPDFAPGTRVLVPIGGGKDSAVSLELLKKAGASLWAYIINPRGATLATVQAAGLPKERAIRVSRTLDPNMLALNRQGYLNGHTPFSALAAFSSLLAARMYGLSYIALSNESSANESTVAGSTVNHQYSKSFKFEMDFHRYRERYLPGSAYYFSLLRPLSEFQIAKYFAGQKQYHRVFRSCNAGSKTDSWCGRCPKCLFVYLILSPFLESREVEAIFGRNMLEDVSLRPTLEQLIGMQEEKPFECVGSRDEINTAAVLAIDRMEREGKALPALLAFYKDSGMYEAYRAAGDPFSTYFDEENLLPGPLKELVRKACASLE